ncbi:SDR family NAD(P)-dependent oxidoreductase [Nonomuraea salmonea]|uniref:SDR family NAD(P)-dependent oxidoreductase n=1 Tax=Nonomuraea salmonea TaxID=46181 RepID=UPI002FE8B80B
MTTKNLNGFRIEGAVALVTGANRGLGRHFARQLLNRGAARVYATARRPETIDLPGVVPLRLDVTDEAQVLAAAAAATDVTLLVNNAGVSHSTYFLTTDPAAIRAEMETNFWGTLAAVRAFAPALTANGGGAILNVLSAQSWHAYPGTNGYHATKAAQWALTNGVRLELPGTLVTALHLGGGRHRLQRRLRRAEGRPGRGRAGRPGRDRGGSGRGARRRMEQARQEVAGGGSHPVVRRDPGGHGLTHLV